MLTAEEEEAAIRSELASGWENTWTDAGMRFVIGQLDAARARTAELEAERERLREAATTYIAELDRYPYWTMSQTQAEDALRALIDQPKET